MTVRAHRGAADLESGTAALQGQLGALQMKLDAAENASLVCYPHKSVSDAVPVAQVVATAIPMPWPSPVQGLTRWQQHPSGNVEWEYRLQAVDRLTEQIQTLEAANDGLRGECADLRAQLDGARASHATAADSSAAANAAAAEAAALADSQSQELSTLRARIAALEQANAAVSKAAEEDASSLTALKKQLLEASELAAAAEASRQQGEAAAGAVSACPTVGACAAPFPSAHCLSAAS